MNSYILCVTFAIVITTDNGNNLPPADAHTHSVTTLVTTLAAITPIGVLLTAVPLTAILTTTLGNVITLGSVTDTANGIHIID